MQRVAIGMRMRIQERLDWVSLTCFLGVSAKKVPYKGTPVHSAELHSKCDATLGYGVIVIKCNKLCSLSSCAFIRRLAPTGAIPEASKPSSRWRMRTKGARMAAIRVRERPDMQKSTGMTVAIDATGPALNDHIGALHRELQMPTLHRWL